MNDSKRFTYIFRFLTALVGLVAAYTLLTATSPYSLWRRFLPDPSADIYMAMAASVLFFILCFFIFFSRDQAGFRKIVEINRDKIMILRAEGRSEEQIADEILEALGLRPGRRSRLAKRKLMIYLSEVE